MCVSDNLVIAAVFCVVSAVCTFDLSNGDQYVFKKKLRQAVMENHVFDILCFPDRRREY